MKKQNMSPVRNSRNKKTSAGQNKEMISNGVKIPKSVKIHIRREKAKIRKSGVSPDEEQKIVNELYQKCGIVR